MVSRPNFRNKFQPDGFKDALFAILFVVHLVAVGGWISYSASTGIYTKVYESATSENAVALLQGRIMSVQGITTMHAACSVAALSLTMSFGAAIAWMTLLQITPETMVYASLYSWVVLLGLSAVSSALAGSILGCLFSALMAVFMVCLIMASGNSIRFTASCFKGVSNVYKSAPGVFLVATFVVVLQILWQAVSMAAMAPTFYEAQQDTEARQAAAGDEEEASMSPYTGGVFALLLSYYWGAQVCSNLLHITCSGIVGRWYFNKGTESAVSSATKQAFTNFFGSVCFGSLLVALIQTLKHLAEQKRSDSRRNGSAGEAILAMILVCILDVLESLAKIFNTFAFVVCAIYGTDYITGGQEGLRVLTQSGCQVLLQYNFASIVCFMSALMAAVIVAGATYAVAAVSFLPAGYCAGLALFGLIATFFIMSVVSRILESGVDTLFVCYAEEPSKLASSAPEVKDAFDEVKQLR